MKNKGKSQQTLMAKKFYSTLLGGTLTMMVVSVLLMSDQVIAGFVIGADAVAGITLVTPVYSLAAFFGSVFSLGVPILYSTEMGKFNKERADQVFGLGLFCLATLICKTVLFRKGSLSRRQSIFPGCVLPLWSCPYRCSSALPFTVTAMRRFPI